MSDPGWQVWAQPDLAPWIAAANAHVDRALAAPVPEQMRQGGTWYVGLDLLPNDESGALDGVPLGVDMPPLHRGQVSVVWPGYPGRDAGESAAAHRFRLLRDAAHVDGLLPIGAHRSRMLREPHAFILGLPLTAHEPGASPLVVYEGSHRIIGPALAQVLRSVPVHQWPDVDLTEAYTAARREVFERCARVEVQARPGEVIRLHRHMVHGIAPWRAPEGPARRVAYFRPEFAEMSHWLTQDR